MTIILGAGAGAAEVTPPIDIFGETYTKSTNKTDEEVITLPISLYAPVPQDVTVTLSVVTVCHDSDVGTGKDYELSATTATILGGNVLPETPITLTIVNNPLYNLDRLIAIALTTNYGILSYILMNITLVDDARPNLLTVDDSDGSLTAAGLDACVADVDFIAGTGTDDRIPLQAILDYLKDNGGGVVRIPSGKGVAALPRPLTADAYRTLKLPAIQQVTIAGDDNSAGILCLPRDDKVPDHPETFAGWHFLTSGWAQAGAAYCWAHLTDDSPGLVLSNLILDGNGPNLEGWGWEKRAQQYLLITEAYPGATHLNQGRVKVILDSCIPRNSLSGGFNIFRNCDARINNCDFADNHWGGPVVIGGWTKIKWTGGSCRRITTMTDALMGFQEEVSVDSGMWGYNLSAKTEWDISDVNPVDNLIDMAFTGDHGSTLTMARVVQDITKRGGWDLLLCDTLTDIEDCVFYNRPAYVSSTDPSGSLGTIRGTVRIRRTTFWLGTLFSTSAYGNSSATIHACIPVEIGVQNGADVELDTCTFGVGADYPNPAVSTGNIVETCCVRINTLGLTTAPALVNLKDCIYTGKFVDNINASMQGVNLTIDGGTFTAPNSSGTMAKGNHIVFIYNNNSLPSAAVIKNVDLTGLTSGRFLAICYAPNVACTLDVSDDVTLPQACNEIATSWATWPANLVVTGGRLIQAANNTPPAATVNGFVGDIYRLLNGTQYICTAVGWNYYANWWSTTYTNKPATWALV